MKAQSRTPLPLPRGEEKVVAVREMFDAIAPRYVMVNRLLTFGLDHKWRRRTARSLNLEPQSVVMDLACGTGELCRILQAQGLVAFGIDSSAGMLDNARTDVPLIQADALVLPFANASVDGVTCGFALRNFVALQPFFTELARVVRPGGRIALLDASAPTAPVVRQLHSLYFGKVVPWFGGLVSDPSAYKYLPESLAYMPPAVEVLAMLEATGFIQAQRQPLTFGAAYLLTATRS